jgi:glyoxylate utilization-related uncharacterized protein
LSSQECKTGICEIIKISTGGETFLWMVEGTAVVTVSGKKFEMKSDETLLIPPGNKFLQKYCMDGRL